MFTVADCPDRITEVCEGKECIVRRSYHHSTCIAEKIIALGHGGIQRDEPVWLHEGTSIDAPHGMVHGSLCDPSERPFESRTDYNKFMAANPHIQPLG
ncbi:MAG TPA: hypothetical protein DCE18_19500 [Syntrophobacteraceae bacterium]|jgi:hypothetical protein|nr:hypothetical protein [Syntrophobacteraceae bacterium]